MDRASIENLYTLSPMQRSILFFALYAPSSGMFVEQVSLNLEDHMLDTTLFQKAWEHVLARHPMLRTAFHWDELEEPLQLVHKRVTLPFQLIDISQDTPKRQEAYIKEWLAADRRRGFKLDQAPLMRLVIFQLSSEKQHLVLSFHHLLLDGWSLALVSQEAMRSYDAFLAGQQPRLPQPPPPYQRYISWLREQDLEKAEGFWRSVLKGFDKTTFLGPDKAPDSLPSGEDELNFQDLMVSLELTERLTAVARQHRITLNTLITGAWSILLSHYSNSQDIVFGYVVSGRALPIKGIQKMVGLFINTLPMRVQLQFDEPVLTYLQRLNARQQEQTPYEHASIEKIHACSELAKNEPLFDYVIVFNNFPMEVFFKEQGALDFERTNYAMTLSVRLKPQLRLECSYYQNRFDDSVVEQFLNHLVALLEIIAANPQQRFFDLPTMPLGQQKQLLYEWNNTRATYGLDASVCDLICTQAGQHPAAVAVQAGEESLSYEALEKQSNQLAHYLMAVGVELESRVGLCVGRHCRTIVAMLAVLKAGGVYVPLDPANPPARLAYQCEDSGMTLILADEAGTAVLSEVAPPVHQLGVGMAKSAELPATPPPVVVDGDNLAYIIYTSGSTGEPKGVGVTHRALLNHTQSAVRAYGLTASDRVLQFANFSFDTSAEEIYPTLVSGGRLVLRDEEMLGTVRRFARRSAAWGITVWNLPTAYWHEVALAATDVTMPETVRLVIIGGERAQVARWRVWLDGVGEGGITAVNTYGPTEVTIVATRAPLHAGMSTLPIGRPIDNIEVYVLDRALRPVAVGVVGELYLGGAGLARGYVGRAGQTAAAFVPHPYSQEAGARLYRTGDRVRYAANGDLVFVGRVDNQVKVRGYRIELGEVEAALNRCEGVKAAAAVVRPGEVDGQAQLIGFVVTAVEANVKALREQLRTWLPSYMVPTRLVQLAEMPLTTTGKIDRQALPALGEETTEARVYIAPQTETEAILAEIWAELLSMPQVGIQDNFFDLGGHSLLLAQVITRLAKRFQIEVPLRTLFEFPTIAELALRIEELLLADIEDMTEEEVLMMLGEA